MHVPPGNFSTSNHNSSSLNGQSPRKTKLIVQAGGTNSQATKNSASVTQPSENRPKFQDAKVRRMDESLSESVSIAWTASGLSSPCLSYYCSTQILADAILVNRLTIIVIPLFNSLPSGTSLTTSNDAQPFQPFPCLSMSRLGKIEGPNVKQSVTYSFAYFF